MALTHDDLLALRNANDSVSFYWGDAMLDYGQGFGGRSFAIARKRSASSIYGTTDRVIILSDPIFAIYDAGGCTGGRAPRSCYTSASSPRVNPEWQTVVGLLRVGDVLIPEWIGGNTNELTRAAGLTYDEFRLRVRRPLTGDRFRHLTFILNHMVTQANSSSRMIQL
jgi:hypothetical protein